MPPDRTTRPLRIGVISPISWRTPPRHYGPWEQFASHLTEGLVRRGHDVTLFATADSITAARLVAVAPTGYSEDPELDAKVWEALHVSSAFAHAGELDLVHNGFDFVPLTYAALVDVPVLTTIHGFSSEAILPAYEAAQDRSAYVSISDADRHPRLRYAATIHHGIPMDHFASVLSSRDELVFFGRIHPDKGTHHAIEAASAAGLALVIAGIVQDRAYFDELVAPRLDGDRVRYVGPVGPEGRQALLGGAAALLHLVDFDEPFGYSVVEAMACGTPVVASRRGSMPELVEPGVNGMLVEATGDADLVAEAVRACAGIERAGVRRSVEVRFGVERMVDDYVALYREVLAGLSSARR